MVAFISFIFWTIIGSFLSVLIWRLKNKEWWILFGRSKCPKCNHILGVLDLFPIFSYIFLKWKCRYCGYKISLIYPFLELVTWLVFVFISYILLGSLDLNLFFNNIGYVLYWWLIGALFVALAFYDILFYEINFCLAWLLAMLLIIPQFLWIVWNFKLALILAFVWFVLFILISYIRLKVRKIEWMWGWDALWAWLLGLLMPVLADVLNFHYPIWLQFYVLLLLGFFVWWVVWLGYILLWKSTKFSLPFLPFMFLAIIFFAFWGEKILSFIY